MRETKTINWGVIAPGKISKKFAQDMSLVEGNEIISVASRSLERAQEFADEFKVSKVYGDYDSILSDPDIDILYIATPHTFHAEWAIKALNAKKHVLCEKPLGINIREVKSIIEASKRNKMFLMEAMWSRFNPTINKCLALLEEGVIGAPNYINADFTFFNNPSEEGRLLNMDLAGGSLLDIGIYPLFLAYIVFGMPLEVKAIGRYHATGADTQIGVSMIFKNGIAQAASSIISNSAMEAKISGKKGAIYLDSRWHEAQGYSVEKDGKRDHFDLPSTGFGYSHEIEECAKCIINGQIESTKWSHQNSLDLISIMDEIRSQIGLKYPFER